MKKIYFFLGCILITSVSFAQSKSVLFIGNSYTGVNNLPQLTSLVSTSAGYTTNTSAQTPGGAQLSQHVINPIIIGAIQSQSWDYVVLQEQSQKPSFGPASVATNVFPHAKTLCDTIRDNDSCTQPMFYMTWGRKFGDAANCAALPWVCTYQGMDSALNDSYRRMGQQNDALVSPVGAVWNYIIANHSTLNLYSSDNSHPSKLGSYAAACTFFTMIHKANPNLITYNYTINASDAAIIRNAVKVVCYDSLTKWNVGKYDPEAKFTFNQFGSTVTFVNSSTHGYTYLWEFGDGNSSTSLNPTHNYSSPGTYSVKLIVTKCNLSDTLTKTLTISTVGVVENKKADFSIYPNPSSEGIITIISSSIYNLVKVYSAQGKWIESYSIQQASATLNLAHLSKGVYWIEVEGIGVKKVVLY